MSRLFDSTVDVLSKSLDLYLARHTVISDNIANAETPHFKARKLEFEAQLQSAVDAGDSGGEEATQREIAQVKPLVTPDLESETGQDMNTVDMDREMAAMTKNDVKYSASVQAVQKKFALLKYAIGEVGDR